LPTLNRSKGLPQKWGLECERALQTFSPAFRLIRKCGMTPEGLLVFVGVRRLSDHAAIIRVIHIGLRMRLRYFRTRSGASPHRRRNAKPDANVVPGRDAEAQDP